MPKRTLLLALALLAGLMLCACKTDPAKTALFRGNTDPVAERMLLALDRGDYQDFIAAGDQGLKSTVTQAEFASLRAASVGIYGSYKHKTFFTHQQNPTSLIVQYALQFSGPARDPLYALLEFNRPDGTGEVTNFQIFSEKAR